MMYQPFTQGGYVDTDKRSRAICVLLRMNRKIYGEAFPRVLIRGCHRSKAFCILRSGLEIG